MSLRRRVSCMCMVSLSTRLQVAKKRRPDFASCTTPLLLPNQCHLDSTLVFKPLRAIHSPPRALLAWGRRPPEMFVRRGLTVSGGGARLGQAESYFHRKMYELHNLGWNSFQQLCLTVVREILGQTVESFLDSSDGGRDGAFTGTWKRSGKQDIDGRFVIQCKFTSRGNYVLRSSDLRDEVKKVKRLVARGLCDSYVLMTNAGLAGKRGEDIEAIL